MKLAWDLGPFAAVPPCLHLDTPLLEQQNTEKLSGTKNISVHAQLGQILDPKDTKRLKNTTATFEEPGAKSRRLGVKAGHCSSSLSTASPTGRAKLLNHSSSPSPGHTPYKQQTQKGTCCLFLLPLWYKFRSVQFSRSVVSDSSQPHELQYARPPCPSPTSRVHSNSCLSSQ